MIDLIQRESIFRLDETVRFNGTRTLQRKESVSQHSFWVVFYVNLLFRGLYYKAIMLCDDQEKQNSKVNRYCLLYSFILWQAIWHDFDENETGDVLYNTKYDSDYGDDIKKALNKIKHKQIELWPRDIIYDDYKNVLRTDYFGELPAHELTAGEKSICLTIVKMADWLSSMRFSFVELQMGNKLFEGPMSKAINGIYACLTQIELYDIRFEFTDENFVNQIKNELIELQTKFQIL